MTTDKTALITGITGQDGAYLAELLLGKGYVVHGLRRRASSENTQRIDHLLTRQSRDNPRLILHYGDMTDTSNLFRIVKESAPDEIYNLAAQSHVQVSFESPEYTANADAIGPLRLLEAVRSLGLADKVRFFQASTSELYGAVTEEPQNEKTPFAPRSPYAAAKLYAYWVCVNYRQAYGIHACNGIMFNHESPLRGEDFVTRKITRGVAAIKHGKQQCLYLGNLDAQRDWGHARDYVLGMWQIMQNDTPDDFVLATGQAYYVRDFVSMAFAHAGIDLDWRGSGIDEIAVCRNSGQTVVAIDPQFFRPTDVAYLRGDASKARDVLGWQAVTEFHDLVREMVDADMAVCASGA